MRSMMTTPKVGKHPGLFLLWGIIIVILGIIAISVSVFTTLVSVLFLGFLLIFGSLVMIFDTFKTWRKDHKHFILFLVFSLLYLIVGIMLVKHPLLAAVSITLILGIFYLIVGIFRIIGSIALHLPHWGWSLVSGIIALILGLLILMHWPASSLIVIGLFVGIDLLFLGWTYIILALTVRKQNKLK